MVLALTGDGSLEAHYRERAVTVVPPRGHVAAALIALAEQLARDAHDIEEQR
ncbi:hypothetical protein L332_03510 [Agrococcus pavilionensis RW1]|uniref:Uncharacterized protein n=1 Tax=Agrococcus pavilionensis RW1 TaxID=1330458 RepID=U1MNP9_9MICO|nr:hypothetical protein L332_03510 [Agrococcus pavilionensis RW1]